MGRRPLWISQNSYGQGKISSSGDRTHNQSLSHCAPAPRLFSYIVPKNIFKYERFFFNVGEHRLYVPLVGATSDSVPLLN